MLWFILGFFTCLFVMIISYLIYDCVRKYRYRTLLIENLRGRTYDLNRRLRDVEYRLSLNEENYDEKN